jgi:hypothetical protein
MEAAQPEIRDLDESMAVIIRFHAEPENVFWFQIVVHPVAFVQGSFVGVEQVVAGVVVVDFIQSRCNSLALLGNPEHKTSIDVGIRMLHPEISKIRVGPREKKAIRAPKLE